ncbi:MAG: hypothetical protein B6D37_14645 [Sphingobacteriales bacterium UTBCD1]|jgi:hypothetical protein|nr:MAG: hypothetical protein B6D37_14645 [Sphingobacteriales bacterium UTBCD1]
MKRILILVIASVFMLQTHGQYIKDKNAFANAFIKIFNERGNGFDSLSKVQGEEDTLKNPSKILPQANKCYVSMNAVFGGLYTFPDSVKAVSFFKELQDLLGYTAGAYKARAVFEPLNGDPTNLGFYFRDAEGYTENLMTISFSRSYEIENTSAKNQEFEVLLLIHPGGEMCYFTSAGPKITDEPVSAFINKLAFNTDTLLTQYKINKRTDPQKNSIYDSKINLSGFSTTITEVKGKKGTGIHVTTVRDYTALTWKKFEPVIDSFLQKLKAAMPADFVYQIYYDDNFIEFKPAHFAKYDDKVASISLSYSILQNKKNTYRIELKISRVKQTGI